MTKIIFLIILLCCGTVSKTMEEEKKPRALQPPPPSLSSGSSGEQSDYLKKILTSLSSLSSPSFPEGMSPLNSPRDLEDADEKNNQKTKNKHASLGSLVLRDSADLNGSYAFDLNQPVDPASPRDNKQEQTSLLNPKKQKKTFCYCCLVCCCWYGKKNSEIKQTIKN